MAATKAYSQEPERAITQLRGDLYSFKDGSQVSVFLVTPAGIILGDPLSRETAAWLATEFAGRFPDRPVRYVLYSHHHADRASGGRRFALTAEFVGHSRFNDRLQASAHSDIYRYAYVQKTQSGYRDRRMITLSGKQVELVHPGSLHSGDMTVLRFPAERIVFAVEGPAVGRAPFSFSVLPVAAVIKWVRTIASLDFDTLLTDTGEMVSKQAIVDLADYLDDLIAGVAANFEKGASLVDLRASSILESRRASPHYVDRDAQIDYVYQTARFAQAAVYGFAAVNRVAANHQYCSGYQSCSIDGQLREASAGASVGVRQLAVAVELRLAGQSFASRATSLYGDAFARREMFVSALFRLSSRPRKSLSFAALAGPTFIRSDAKGEMIVKQAFAPFGGRKPLTPPASSGFALTVGGEIVWALRGSLGLVVPVRITKRSQPNEYSPGALDVQGGVGLRFVLVRRML